MGAGLPAKAVGQLAFVPPDTPLSRASPLPQGIRGVPIFLSQAQIQMWELACLRLRWISWHFWRLTRRHRGQARSHRRLEACLFFEPGAIQMWELACLRKRWFGWYFWRLAHRHRGQARSHRGLLVYLFFEPGANSNVGAGLPAIAVVRLAFLATDTPPSRASRLPQGMAGVLIF